MIRIILVVLSILPLIYSAWSMKLMEEQRKKPLPAEVADVYDPERYQKYLEYKKDSRKPSVLAKAAALCLTLFVFLSPFYHWMEQISDNIYILAVVTFLIQDLIDLLIGLPFNYYSTFVIRQKYGLNKKDHKEFAKDIILGQVFSVVVGIPLYLGLSYLLSHIVEWTHGFQLELGKAILLMAAIGGVFFLFIVAASFFSWFILRMQYTFTEMEDGELKDKIIELTRDCKKKVQKIEVYNESKKSTTKNAFLLKLLWVRRFGIADNFMNENSERELLGVLSHEIGHLKHKKNIYNYLNYAIIGVLIVFCIMVMTDGAWVIQAVEGLNQAFGLNTVNPVLLEAAVGAVMTPISFLISIYRTFVTRTEEYEADRNAVKNGYGEDLIQTFKTLSSDELIDVNPHPLIEALTYDHPGMYNRIKTIHEEIAKERQA